MKKGFQIVVLIVCLLTLGALILNFANGGIFIIEGLNGKDGADGVNGKDGVDGVDGANGVDGTNGKDGKSAYELAREDGFEGSLHEWLLSLAVRGSDGAPGKSGQDGVGVKGVRIDSDGNLLVTLTDGNVLTAGNVGTDGSGVTSTEPDADGFYEVYETVVQVEASSLTLRLSPDTTNGEVLTYISKGTELLRVGDQKTENGFSRFVYNGTICYARSHYFEVKYEYTGEIPTLNLPESMILTKGIQSWFITGQILPEAGDGMKVAYSYSGKGTRIYDGGEAFAITPSATGDATLTVRVEKWADDDLRTICSRTVNITVVEEKKDLALTGIVIGDSRISSGDLVTDLAEKMPNLKLLGTQTVKYSGVHHEGRGGWSTEDYLSCASLTIAGQEKTNVFYNPETKAFDFSYYMKANYSTETLDFVVINLGANDTYSQQSVENLNTMVESIKTYAKNQNSEIQIFVMTEYLSPEEGYSLTEADISKDPNMENKRRQQAQYFTYLREAFEGREAENVYLLPNFLCINDWSDWPRATVDTMNGEAERIVDVVHLGSSGYQKESAVIRAYLYWLFGV